MTTRRDDAVADGGAEPCPLEVQLAGIVLEVGARGAFGWTRFQQLIIVGTDRGAHMAALFYFIQVLGVFLNKNIGLAGGTVLWSVVLYNNRWPVQSPSGTYGRQSFYASLSH